MPDVECGSRCVVSAGYGPSFRWSCLRSNCMPSTQVCNIDPQRVRFLSEAGFTRVILERALSLEEIGRLSRAADVEIETFVHGAICVSYSGRCYMSRTMGPRSGNRGDCSQSCRLPYDLLDERMRPLERNRHLLSLQDMNATGQIEELIGAGVTSFKIEGRLKDENYVRNVVGWYRRKLDGILARRDDLAPGVGGYLHLGIRAEPGEELFPGGDRLFPRGSTRRSSFVRYAEGVRGAAREGL